MSHVPSQTTANPPYPQRYAEQLDIAMPFREIVEAVQKVVAATLSLIVGSLTLPVGVILCACSRLTGSAKVEKASLGVLSFSAGLIIFGVYQFNNICYPSPENR